MTKSPKYKERRIKKIRGFLVIGKSGKILKYGHRDGIYTYAISDKEKMDYIDLWKKKKKVVKCTITYENH